MVDNGSSYTGDLMALLEGLMGGGNGDSGNSSSNSNVRRVIPSELNLGTISRYDGIILSGRRRDDRLMNAVNSQVVSHVVQHGRAKLLGICYGAEIMALTLGGTIRRCAAPQKNVRVSVTVSQDTPIAPAGTVDVFESHSYEIARLPDMLEGVAGSAECRYEIIRHHDMDVYGTQFHPEMSRDGRYMIERFCRMLQ